MDIMSAIAPYVASVWTICAVILGLCVWAATAAYRMLMRADILLNALRRSTELIAKADSPTAFTGRFDVIARELGDDPVLGTRWREYQQSLLVPEAGPIRATERADTWFDIGLLRAPAVGIDPRYDAALPGLLVGAGLLFTFLGLAVALHSAGDIVAENVTQAERNAALHQLLSAASFKFWTSVAGLALSIAFALFRKNRLAVVESALETFQAALDERIPLITSAQMLQTQSHDLDAALGRRLGEHVGPLTEVMRGLADKLTGRNEDAVERMLEAFLAKLHDGSGDQMARVADRLGVLAAGLEGLQNGLQTAARHMADTADAMARQMGQGAEQAIAGIAAQIQGLVETLKALATQTREAGVDASQALAARLETATAGFEQAARTVADSVKGATGNMADQVTAFGATAGEAARPLADATEQLRHVAEQMRAATAPLLEVANRAAVLVGQVATTAEGLQTAQSGVVRLTDSMDRTAQRFEGVDKNLAAVLAQLQGAIGRFAGDVTQLISQTDSNLTNATDQVGLIVKSLDDSIQDLVAALPDRPRPPARRMT